MGILKRWVRQKPEASSQEHPETKSSFSASPSSFLLLLLLRPPTTATSSHLGALRRARPVRSRRGNRPSEKGQASPDDGTGQAQTAATEHQSLSPSHGAETTRHRNQAAADDGILSQSNAEPGLSAAAGSAQGEKKSASGSHDQEEKETY